jgi:hypothetical protein
MRHSAQNISAVSSEMFPVEDVEWLPTRLQLSCCHKGLKHGTLTI